MAGELPGPCTVKTTRCAAGFTVVELMIALSITSIAVLMAIRGSLFLLRETRMRGAQDQLDIDVQIAMERVKRHLRVSSLDAMFFYPDGAGPYRAISLPTARDDDGDGAVETDSDDKIIWDRTLIYHVWNGQPNELRLTIFDPRDTGLTDAQRQDQLDSVVVAGSGATTHNGSNATTSVVFQNLFTWSVRPLGAVYDGYAPQRAHDRNVVLGSVLLDSGSHAVAFEAIGKHDDSAGYAIALDSLVVSPSYGKREAENYITTSDSVGPLPVREFMPGGSWSGNYQLRFPATQDGQSLTLTMENDLWTDTNFDAAGDAHSDTFVLFDSTFEPSDFVVSLRGLGTNWLAAAQTGDPTGVPAESGLVRGSALRVVIKGEHMQGGNWIDHSGGRCKIAFRSGPSHGIGVRAAFLAECASSTSNSMDTVPGSERQLLFGGLGATTIPPDSTIWSDLADLPIDREKSYLVSYLLDDSPGNGTVWKWQDHFGAGAAATFLIPSSSSPTASNLWSTAWSGRDDVSQVASVLGIDALFTTYPTQGVYVSRIFDTHVDAPAYTEIMWNATVPTNSDIRLKIRTGTQSDLSDAPAWTNLPAAPLYGMINPGDRRFIQYLVEMHSDPTGYVTPKLKDFTVKWHGPQRVVDVGGSFTLGPSNGIFKVTVDGKELVTGISVGLEIYNGTRGYEGTFRQTSSLTAEITPRNNGL
ncbi:MAG: prepilin-type N-terminal cleavage/methylation domain-containing protein [Verrucomicrobia bacterium]|nr:prepilin-type N-terminal cleavage/methylation domain-containing protein [Verrucomicrobiota bacterium]